MIPVSTNIHRLQDAPLPQANLMPGNQHPPVITTPEIKEDAPFLRAVVAGAGVYLGYKLATYIYDLIRTTNFRGVKISLRGFLFNSSLLIPDDNPSKLLEEIKQDPRRFIHDYGYDSNYSIDSIEVYK